MEDSLPYSLNRFKEFYRVFINIYINKFRRIYTIIFPYKNIRVIRLYFIFQLYILVFIKKYIFYLYYLLFIFSLIFFIGLKYFFKYSNIEVRGESLKEGGNYYIILRLNISN